MDFSLTSQQLTRREEIVRFARAELNPGALERDRDAIFSRDLFKKCGQSGLVGPPLPKQYSGGELDGLSTALSFEALGYGCIDGGLVFSIGAHLFSCAVPIWKHGTDEQKGWYLKGLAEGTLIGSNATSEPNAGSDIFSMSTRAEKTTAGFRLTGDKTFVSNATVADLLLVTAVTDEKKHSLGGLTAFLVETSAPGVHVKQPSEKMGLRTAPLADVVLDGVEVPDSAVLGKVGAGSGIFTQFMEWERVGLFAAHVGTMERLLEKAIAHARTRKQFGQPIGQFQAIAHRVADMKVRLEAARLLVYQAAWSLDRSKSIAVSASIAKLFTSEALVETAHDTLRILGGYGYLTRHEVERALRDAVGSTLYSGTSDIQRNIIARWLGV